MTLLFKETTTRSYDSGLYKKIRRLVWVKYPAKWALKGYLRRTLAYGMEGEPTAYQTKDQTAIGRFRHAGMFSKHQHFMRQMLQTHHCQKYASSKWGNGDMPSAVCAINLCVHTAVLFIPSVPMVTRFFGTGAACSPEGKVWGVCSRKR